jgi:Probable Zinc-ribbon domain
MFRPPEGIRSSPLMSGRDLKPLNEKYPHVAATWDSDANGRPCPVDQHPGSSRAVIWRCANDHHWQEPIARRVKMEPWKAGDRAACRVCVGGWVETTFVCGHRVGVPASKAREHNLCPDCWNEERGRREAAYEAAKAARRVSKAELLPRCKAEAVVETERLWSELQLERIPTVLRGVARQQLVGAITETVVVQHLGGKARIDLRALLTELSNVAEFGLDGVNGHGHGPVRLFGQQFWAPSLTGEMVPTALPEPDLLASLAAVAERAVRLEDEIGTWIARDWMIEIAYEDNPNAPIPASWVTPHITDTLKSWASEHAWRSFRELRVPLRDTRTFGRLDLVVFRDRLPDLVIEISPRSGRASRLDPLA